jgi:hypothetical protein
VLEHIVTETIGNAEIEITLEGVFHRTSPTQLARAFNLFLSQPARIVIGAVPY